MVHSVKWGSSFNTPAPRFCGVDFKDDSPADNSSAVNSDAWGGHANRHLAPSLEKPISQSPEKKYCDERCVKERLAHIGLDQPVVVNHAADRSHRWNDGAFASACRRDGESSRPWK